VGSTTTTVHIGALPIMLIRSAIAKRVQAARPSKRLSRIMMASLHSGFPRQDFGEGWQLW
jgi:hypothetical protein